MLRDDDFRLCLCVSCAVSRCDISHSDTSHSRPVAEVVEEAVSGGCTMVQVREKAASARAFYRLAVEMRKLAKRLHVPLIVNDRLDIALAVGADGVHLGQQDMPVEAARRLFGGGVVGISAGTAAQAVLAEEGGADYIGAGAVFPTSSKDDAGTAIGLERLREICAAVKIPVIAIGGIHAENAPAVMRCGASGVAVISAILSKPDAREAARELRSAVTLP
jgi:thiamine-phosphate pyrophosphorylase